MLFKSKKEKEELAKQERIKELDNRINPLLYSSLEANNTPNFKKVRTKITQEQLLFFERLINLFIKPLNDETDYRSEWDAGGKKYIQFTKEFTDILFEAEFPEKKNSFLQLTFYDLKDGHLNVKAKNIDKLRQVFSEYANLFNMNISVIPSRFTVRGYLIRKLMPNDFISGVSDEQLLTYIYSEDTYKLDISYTFITYLNNKSNLQTLVKNIIEKQCIIRNMSYQEIETFKKDLNQLVFVKLKVQFNHIFPIIVSLNDTSYFENVYSVVQILKSHEYNSLMDKDRDDLFQTKVAIIFNQVISQNSQGNKKIVSDMLDTMIK